MEIHERCAAALVSRTLTACLYAPTCAYDVAYYETVVGQLRTMSHEARVLEADIFLLVTSTRSWACKTRCVISKNFTDPSAGKDGVRIWTTTERRLSGWKL